jgi:hypothetical protein
LRLTGLDWSAHNLSTLSRQQTLAVDIPYRGSKGPLHLLINSTGIKVENTGVWQARGNYIGDILVLPDLLGHILANQEIGSGTDDGAYGTRKYHNAMADRSANAVIPPRKNAKP